MTLTSENLYTFLCTFSSQELDDAEVIAKYHAEDSEKSYIQILTELLVEMSQARWSVQAGG